MNTPTFTGGRSAYEVLGVAADAPHATIDQVRRQLVLAHHPDRVRAAGGDAAAVADATATLAEINMAWQLLGDPAARAAYDRHLADEAIPVVDVDEGWVDDDIVDTPPHARTDDDGWDTLPDPPTPTTTTVGAAVKIGRRSGLRWPLAGALTLAAAAAATGFWWHMPGRWWWVPGTVALAVVAAAITAGKSAVTAYWHRTRRIGWRTPTGGLWGTLNDDPDSGLLEDHIVTVILDTVPGTVAYRNSYPDASFSHVIVRGNRAAYLRAVTALPGRYWWQNATLIGSNGTRRLAAARVAWPDQTQAVRRTRLVAHRWVLLAPITPGTVTIAPTTPAEPDLLLLDNATAPIAAWLAGSPTVNRHPTLFDAYLALGDWEYLARL